MFSVHIKVEHQLTTGDHSINLQRFFNLTILCVNLSFITTVQEIVILFCQYIHLTSWVPNSSIGLSCMTYFESAEDHGSLRWPIASLRGDIIALMLHKIEGVGRKLGESRFRLQANNHYCKLLPNHLPKVRHCIG